MKAYISISYSKRKSIEAELDSIKETLKTFNIEPFVFVDQFKFTPKQEKEMMQQAMLSIDDCDLVIAETSDKAIGIGIEVGYAKAKRKSVIYMRNKNAEHSTTVSGISDFQIVYTDIKDLKEQLSLILSGLVH